MNDIEEIMPPEVSGLNEGMVTALMPTASEFTNTLWAGAGVVGGMVVARQIEKIATDTLKLPRVTLPFIHGIVGIMVGKAVSRYSQPLGVGAVGAFGAYALVRALDSFLGVKVPGFSAFDDVGDIADLLADVDGGDDGNILPPELMGADYANIPEDMNGAMGQVSVETSGYRRI